jgi:hypothetical protein
MNECGLRFNTTAPGGPTSALGWARHHDRTPAQNGNMALASCKLSSMIHARVWYVAEISPHPRCARMHRLTAPSLVCALASASTPWPSSHSARASWVPSRGASPAARASCLVSIHVRSSGAMAWPSLCLSLRVRVRVRRRPLSESPSEVEAARHRRRRPARRQAVVDDDCCPSGR